MKVFISHAKQDNQIVYRILKVLDDNQIPKWVDLEQLDDVDSKINENINDGLFDSDYFLLIWSRSAKDSKFVRKEYNAAITPDYDKRLRKIIVKLDSTILPALLADTKHHSVTEENLEDVLEQIVFKIKESEKELERTKIFDVYLDESFGDVIIAKHDYPTSYALKKIDPVVYEEDMINWLSNDDISESKDET